MNKAQHIISLCEEGLGLTRPAYQILIQPTVQGVRVRFLDTTTGNPDLKFPPVTMTKEELFRVIPHNQLTEQTYLNALARNDSYGLLVDPRVVAKLAQHGQPETPQLRFQHDFNKKYPTLLDYYRDQNTSGRV